MHCSAAYGYACPVNTDFIILWADSSTFLNNWLHDCPREAAGRLKRTVRERVEGWLDQALHQFQRKLTYTKPNKLQQQNVPRCLSDKLLNNLSFNNLC
jgi:hypothetical protein